jgi:hypothetical protein
MIQAAVGRVAPADSAGLGAYLRNSGSSEGPAASSESVLGQPAETQQPGHVPMPRHRGHTSEFARGRS